MSVEVRNLRLSLEGTPILRGVDLQVADGERVGLIGPSGSGKSMVVRALLGLAPRGARLGGTVTMGGATVLAPRSGDVPEDGTPCDGGADAAYEDAPSAYPDDYAMAALRGRYAGVVFQNPTRTLNPVMTVGRQVELPLRLHYDLTRVERRARVEAMLDKVGLPREVLRRRPCELSGGQRQRVGIAAALVTSPRLIIADEPTTALDSVTQRQITDLLVSLVDESGASMLFVTHDFAVLARATTRCVVLEGGRVVETGPTQRLLASPHAEATRALVGAARELTLDAHGTGVTRTDALKEEA